MRKSLILFVLLCVWISLSSDSLQAQSSSKKLRKLTRSLHELQQEFAELKEDYQKNRSLRKGQQEEFKTLVDRLNRENKELKVQVSDLQKKSDGFELQLELSSAKGVDNRISELKQLLEATLLSTIDDIGAIEPLVLNVVNLAKTQISRDLLIFYLAHINWKNRQYEKSLGYYSTLLTEYEESAYGQRAIFEMAMLFGDQGQTEDQITLLTELSGSRPNTDYTIKAQEILEQLSEGSQDSEVSSSTNPPESDALLGSDEFEGDGDQMLPEDELLPDLPDEASLE
ncbi:MAG: hypothetical protein GY786_01070 [Proteobacteria bacterium]|nr:hypothetical protein [Pseudomonadota bacterium]